MISVCSECAGNMLVVGMLLWRRGKKSRVYAKHMQRIGSHDRESPPPPPLMPCICYTPVPHKQPGILFLKYTYCICYTYARVLHNMKFHCILTRVHNLGHMLSTCCYAKTFVSLAYVSIENEPGGVESCTSNAHAGHMRNKTCSCGIS